MQSFSHITLEVYRQTTRTRPPDSVWSRQARVRGGAEATAGLGGRGAGAAARAGGTESGTPAGVTVAGLASRRIHIGSSEMAGGLFNTTVPSDVRVQAATGTSPQQRMIATAALPIVAPG